IPCEDSPHVIREAGLRINRHCQNRVYFTATTVGAVKTDFSNLNDVKVVDYRVITILYRGMKRSPPRRGEMIDGLVRIKLRVQVSRVLLRISCIVRSLNIYVVVVVRPIRMPRIQ